MRFLSAPWLGMLQSGAVVQRAKNANAMAQLLYDEIAQIEGLRIMFPRQANAVFVELPEKKPYLSGLHFHVSAK